MEEGEEAAQLFVSASSRSDRGSSHRSQRRRRNTEAIPVSLHVPLVSHAARTKWIRRAGAEDPGRCPDPAGSSSGLHPSPAGRPRGTASCPRSPSPETKLRAAQTRSRRSLCPVRRGEKKKKKSLRISLTAADTQEVFLTGISNSNLARAR